MPPQSQLPFQIGYLLLRVGYLFFGIGDFPVPLDELLSQPFILAAEALIFALQMLRLFWPNPARPAMRCPQTYTLPGFSANIQVQVQVQDF